MDIMEHVVFFFKFIILRNLDFVNLRKESREIVPNEIFTLIPFF